MQIKVTDFNISNIVIRSRISISLSMSALLVDFIARSTIGLQRRHNKLFILSLLHTDLPTNFIKAPAVVQRNSMCYHIYQSLCRSYAVIYTTHTHTHTHKSMQTHTNRNTRYYRNSLLYFPLIVRNLITLYQFLLSAFFNLIHMQLILYIQ